MNAFTKIGEPYEKTRHHYYHNLISVTRTLAISGKRLERCEQLQHISECTDEAKNTHFTLVVMPGKSQCEEQLPASFTKDPKNCSSARTLGSTGNINS